MQVRYWTDGKTTLVLFGNLLGMSRLREGDTFDAELGIAIALLKASPRGLRGEARRAACRLMSLAPRLGELQPSQVTQLIWLRESYQRARLLNRASRIDKFLFVWPVKVPRVGMAVLSEQFGRRVLKALREEHDFLESVSRSRP